MTLTESWGRLLLDTVVDYRNRIDRFWDALEIEFDSLPPNLYRQSRLVRQNLGIVYSSTGGLRDILREPDASPILHQHLWMLDDQGVPDGPPRYLAEEHLFRAAFCTLAHDHLGEQALTGDPQPLALRGWLLRQMSAALAMVVANDSDFWTRDRRRWESYWEATLAIRDPTYGSTEAELWTIQTARAAPAAAAPLAVAATRETSDLDQVEILLDHLGFVGMVRVEMAAMMRHLARGWVSPTVRRMASLSGMDLNQPARAEVILGEIVLGEAMEKMLEHCRSALSTAEALAGELRLPTFRSYAQQLTTTVSRNPVRTRRARTESDSALPTLQSPRQMAVGFLLADPTLRESWETHRWGLLGAVETSARFPAGLILEILAGHGLDVTEMIDGFFRSTAGKHFAYYDHPAARPYIESDTLGLLLRLYKHSGRTDSHRMVLSEYLELLHKYVGPDGRLPVWLVESDQAQALVLGEGCGTIEANLLLGLLDYQPEEHMSLITPAAHRLLADYIARGVSINVNYPQSYARAVLADLLDRLQELDFAMVEPARRRLRGETLRASQQARVTPQDAACLIWTCSRPGLADLHRESWAEIVARAQSFDGGWPSEPFFFAPAGRGRTMWYSSRLLTTALCYHALSIPKPGA